MRNTDDSTAAAGTTEGQETGAGTPPPGWLVALLSRGIPPSRLAFTVFWLGQSVSVIGSQITILALPLTAVMVLGAGPAQMGILGALSSLPWLILGLPAGAWVDRRTRRPIMIGADLGRFLVLLSVPLSAVAGVLSIELLYAVVLATGILTVLSTVACQAYLSSLVREDELVEANSRLELSRSAAQLVGPGLVGILVQAVTAPIAILADAVSFLVSALTLTVLKVPEPVTGRSDRPGLKREIVEGLAAVVQHPLLRPMVTAMAAMNLFVSVGLAAYTLFVVNELGLSASQIGLVYSLGGLGFLAGASVAPVSTRRIGLGRTVVGGALLAGFAEALIPLAGGPVPVVMVILVSAQGLNALGVVAANVNLVSLRQAVTAPRLQGRVAGTSRVISWGTFVVGSLVGGFLAEAVGLRSTLIVAAVGQILAVSLLFFSPIRSLKERPFRGEREGEAGAHGAQSA